MNKVLFERFLDICENAAIYNNAPAGLREMDEEKLEQILTRYRENYDRAANLFGQAKTRYKSVYPICAWREEDYNSDRAEIAFEEKFLVSKRSRKRLTDPKKTGFAGLFQPKASAEEYQQFCRYAMNLGNVYEREAQKYIKFLKAREYLPQNVSSFIDLADQITDIPRNPEKWAQYPVPVALRHKDIYIGDILAMIDRTEGLDGLTGAGYLKNGVCRVPLSYSCDSSFSLFVEFSGSDAEDRQTRLLRSIIYQILQGETPGAFSITYIDPYRSGGALSDMHTTFGKVEDNNAFLLHQGLYNNIYKLLTVVNTKDEVSEQLKALDKEIGNVISICGASSVTEYNRGRIGENGPIDNGDDVDGAILHRYIIVQDVHGWVSGDSHVDILKKIVRNARKCGYSIIFTSCREIHEQRTKEEHSLLSEHMDVLSIDHQANCKMTLHVKNDSGIMTPVVYDMIPKFPNIDHSDFLEKISVFMQPAFDVETVLNKRIDLDEVWGKSDGTDEIRIPVAVNSRDRVSYITLGNPENPHALLSGKSGCGKSSFIHTIINSIIMHYKPTDVQIWLSDYKSIEFKRYAEHTPAHIKYIGVARSKAYTFHFMDMLVQEMERRVYAFGKNGTVTSIREYRSMHGEDSMPRLLIIVDEFHALANHIKGDMQREKELVSLLREARALGMTFLFSDQTCAEGLEGLKGDGKKQLALRMSMLQTDMMEYNAVFEINNAKDEIPAQEVREIVVRRFRSGHRYYEHAKTLFTPITLRDEIAARSRETYGVSVNPEIIYEPARIMVNWKEIAEAERVNTKRRAGIPVYLGLPVEGGDAVSLDLVKHYDQNILGISPDMRIMGSYMKHVMESVLRQGECEIHIMTQPYSPEYLEFAPWLEEQQAKIPSMHIHLDTADVCRTIAGFANEMNRRFKSLSGERICVIWIGLRDLQRDLEHISNTTRPGIGGQAEPAQEKPLDAAANLARHAASIQAFLEVYGGDEFASARPSAAGSSAAPAGNEEDEVLYNATADIAALFNDGPRTGIHNVVLLPNFGSVTQLRSAKCLYLDHFTHRVVNQVSAQDAISVIANSRNNQDLDGNALAKDVVVYFDGTNAVQVYPFYMQESECKESDLSLS